MNASPDPMRKRVLHTLLRAREPGITPFRRITPNHAANLLRWAATLPDETILDMRGAGHGMLRWIREHQPDGVALPAARTGEATSTFAEVIKRTGWRVELFWNSGGGWFTARLISPWNRDGVAIYPGGYLAPFDDPIGASGATPEEAIRNLADAVLEWA